MQSSVDQEFSKVIVHGFTWKHLKCTDFPGLQPRGCESVCLGRAANLLLNKHLSVPKFQGSCLKESSSVLGIKQTFLSRRLCEGVGSVNVCKYLLETPLENWLY